MRWDAVPPPQHLRFPALSQSVVRGRVRDPVLCIFLPCSRVPRRKYYRVCRQAAIVLVGSRLFFLVITEAGSKRKSESPQRQMLALDGVGREGGGNAFRALHLFHALAAPFSCASWMLGTPDCRVGRTVRVGQLFGSDSSSSKLTRRRGPELDGGTRRAQRTNLQWKRAELPLRKCTCAATVCVRTRTRSGHSAGGRSAAVELNVFIKGTTAEWSGGILEILLGFLLLFREQVFKFLAFPCLKMTTFLFLSCLLFIKKKSSLNSLLFHTKETCELL